MIRGGISDVGIMYSYFPICSISRAYEDEQWWRKTKKKGMVLMSKSKRWVFILGIPLAIFIIFTMVVV